MYRKLFLIFLSAAGLAVLLVFKPWRNLDEKPPRIYDRLPEADVIGISNLLELSESLSKTMFYYKVPFRDLLSPGFILSQGKNYGLDVQSPVFFFINENEFAPDDWGIMVSVRDSSKVRKGIDHLQKFMKIDSDELYKTKVYASSEYNIRMVYGDDWMLFYRGNDLKRILNHVLFAKHNEISPRWREFVNKYYKADIRLVASLQSKEFKELGIESAGVSLSNDSTGLIFTTFIKQVDSLGVQLRSSGPSYRFEEFTRNSINLHFDVNRLKKRPGDPLYQLMKKYSGRISFPLDDFLRAWEGDLAFRQGGFETVQETYIESELDENFNVSEVTKSRSVKVPGFALYLSMNGYSSTFLQQMESKGILTKSGNKSRLLFSPPLNMIHSDTSLSFSTSRYHRKLHLDSLNSILWSYDYTPLEFILDSTSARTIYGKVRLPLRKILSDNMPQE
ncbi:MAG: hypothetical protein A3D92_00745 [Bacteroidetes bacterium RIFCSPHIGHO2_02_FULL_44_7]|nr:MAG: hypothetical protein A3D92_00745 [Bacteroidetes bacterium RIFCSPHIGHO2_02_FULL_44_7]